MKELEKAEKPGPLIWAGLIDRQKNTDPPFRRVTVADRCHALGAPRAPAERAWSFLLLIAW
jgi:hypothetical protein